MSEKFRFIIIGCGRIAERHAAHICARGVLVAVCDIVQEKADALANKYGATAYYNIVDLLQNETNVNVAAICTPNGLHAQHSILCLDAGINVLCEKPMALTVGDCRMMIAAAEKNDKLLTVVKQNRYNPPVVAVKKLLDEQKLGKLFNVQLNCFWNRDKEYYQSSEWKGTAALDGGILFTQFSHFIDMLYWMIGDIKEVKAFSGNFLHDDVIEFEDTGAIAIQFYNGTIGTINYTVNSYRKNMEGSITIFGEKGTIKIGGEYLNTLEYQELDGERISSVNNTGIANDYGTYRGSMSNHDKVYDNLIDVLNKKAVLNISAEEGMKTVEIIRKIYDSVSAENTFTAAHINQSL